MKKHSGFVSILGRPNVGKSTLLNSLVGEKLAGVSPKPQTTRGTVRGILSRPEGQIVFVDTPGLHEPRDLLGNWMMQEARQSLADSDLIYFMTIPVNPGAEDFKMLEVVRGLKKPVFLLINQTDRYPKPHILPVIDCYQRELEFRELIPISAKTGDQVDVLIQKSFECLPENPPFFPEDHLSDQNERFLITEMIREKLYHFTTQEIPYSTAVMIDLFKERDERLIDIEATIVVERDPQKAIVVGKNGQKIKQIGQAARLDMEKFLGKKVFLKLWVKVMEKWKQDKQALKELGYE